MRGRLASIVASTSLLAALVLIVQHPSADSQRATGEIQRVAEQPAAVTANYRVQMPDPGSEVLLVATATTATAAFRWLWSYVQESRLVRRVCAALWTRGEGSALCGSPTPTPN